MKNIFIIILYIFSENEEYFHNHHVPTYLGNIKNIFIIILYISTEHEEYFYIHIVHI